MNPHLNFNIDIVNPKNKQGPLQKLTVPQPVLKFSTFYGNPIPQLHQQHSTPLIRVLSHMYLIYIHPLLFIKIHFNATFPSISSSSIRSPSCKLPYQYFIRTVCSLPCLLNAPPI